MDSSARASPHAIATADGIRKWWTSDVDLEALAGGQGEFRFYGGQSVHKVTVVDSVLPERIAWDVRESFRQEWVGTTIVFTLRPDDNQQFWQSRQKEGYDNRIKNQIRF